MLQVQGAGVGYNRGYQQPRGPQYYADRGCVPLALASGDTRLGTKVGDRYDRHVVSKLCLLWPISAVVP